MNVPSVPRDHGPDFDNTVNPVFHRNHFESSIRETRVPLLAIGIVFSFHIIQLGPQGMRSDSMCSVLRCDLCNKPFDKRAYTYVAGFGRLPDAPTNTFGTLESTLKRHGYYCQSRRAGSSPRARSCFSCAKAKAGCDNKRPKCSRCITKAAPCRYPVILQRAAGPGSRELASPPGTSRVDDREPEDTQMILERSQRSVDDLDPDVADLSADFLQWAGSDLLDAELTGDIQVSLGFQTQAAHDQDLQLLIPPSPSTTVRTLIQRPRRLPGAQRISNLVLHNLKSYPLMIIRDNKLPPFIHLALLSPDMEHHTEPLRNCVSLMSMIGTRGRGNRKLFWKNVRLECERMSQECQLPDFTKWDLVAAMQALTLYILVRLEEGEAEHNNLDFLLVRTVIILSQQFSRSDFMCRTRCALCSGSQHSWKEWLFRESTRRSTMVYHVVNMLIYFEPGSFCKLPVELTLAPLPAKKELWEAVDESKWSEAWQRDPEARMAFGLAANGDLIKVDESRLSYDDAWLCQRRMDARTSLWNSANWEEWCAGMDGLGGLVMLAASLAELELHSW